MLVENYAPGVPARLGVDWGAVHETNPGLVYCSIKGYGEEGPFANYPAMESTVQAMSGISSMAMSEDADPRDPGVAMADAFAGYVAFSAIMVALLERERDGRGRHVTVSMLEAALVLQTASVLSAHEGGERLRRRTNQARFMAKDRRIYANLMFPKWYEAVCTIIGRPDLLEPPWSDPGYRDSAGLEFVGEIEKSLVSRTAGEWEREFTAAGVPASVVRTPEEILGHEHVTQSGLLLGTIDTAGEANMVFDLRSGSTASAASRSRAERLRWESTTSRSSPASAGRLLADAKLPNVGFLILCYPSATRRRGEVDAHEERLMRLKALSLTLSIAALIAAGCGSSSSSTTSSSAAASSSSSATSSAPSTASSEGDRIADQALADRGHGLPTGGRLAGDGAAGRGRRSGNQSG